MLLTSLVCFQTSPTECVCQHAFVCGSENWNPGHSFLHPPVNNIPLGRASDHMLFWHLKSTLRFSPAISNHKLFHNKLSTKARKVFLDVAVLTQEFRDRNKSLELESVMQCERFIWLQGCCYCGLRCRSWWHLAAIARFISACLERYPFWTPHVSWCWFILFICLQTYETPFKISLLIIFRILLCNQKSVCRFVSRAKKGWSYCTCDHDFCFSQLVVCNICLLVIYPENVSFSFDICIILHC